VFDDYLIKEQSQNTVGRMILWEVITDRCMSKIDATSHQRNYGYAPEGYSFYAFRSEQLAEGGYKTTWKCSTSCD
jgi:hypothetical protein